MNEVGFFLQQEVSPRWIVLYKTLVELKQIQDQYSTIAVCATRMMNSSAGQNSLLFLLCFLPREFFNLSCKIIFFVLVASFGEGRSWHSPVHLLYPSSLAPAQGEHKERENYPVVTARENIAPSRRVLNQQNTVLTAVACKAEDERSGVILH